MGLCKETELYEIIDVLSANALPVECDFTAEALTLVAQKDKKRAGECISLILPYAIGDSRIYKIKSDDLKDLIQKGLDK